MTSQPSSAPLPLCSSPSQGSWRRSDLQAALADAERLRAVLRRVELTEHGRQWETPARAARQAAEHLVDATHELLLLVPAPADVPLPIDVPGDLRRR